MPPILAARPLHHRDTDIGALQGSSPGARSPPRLRNVQPCAHTLDWSHRLFE